MQILWFKEIVGRDRGDDIDGNQNGRRTFQVLTDTAQGHGEQVLAHADMPKLGDFFQYVDGSTGADVTKTDFKLVAYRRRAEQLDADNLCNWTVTIEYIGVDEPEAQPAEVDFSPTRYQENMIDDESDPKKPVVNSAGDPFAEGVLRDRTRYTLTIVKNIADADWDPVTAESFQDSLNESPFLAGKFPAHPSGFPAGTCKLTLTAKRVRKVNAKPGFKTFYWIRTATIEIDTRGWNAKVRDAGFRQIVAGVKRPIIDAFTGLPTAVPALLNGSGVKLSEGGTPVIANGPNGFKRYLTKNWGPLNVEY